MASIYKKMESISPVYKDWPIYKIIKKYYDTIWHIIFNRIDFTRMHFYGSKNNGKTII